mmetsp:Transcript_46039/g.104903  ORF Transcript_46039/g.104903 Transcript_46039/m.104903 type:complete len:552 (+) Transcript_46039:582-2237(+)
MLPLERDGDIRGGCCHLTLEGDVAVLLPRVLELLVEQRVQLHAEAGAGEVGLDDVVDETAARGRQGVREQPRIVLHLLGSLLLVEAAEDDVHRTRRAHDGDLGVGPGEVDVTAEMLRGHHVVRPAVRLAGDDGELRDGSLGVCVQQLRAMPDDPPVLLRDSREEPRHVYHRHQGDVEGVAEPHEPRRFTRAVDVEASSEVSRLVRHHPHRPPLQPREARDDILGEVGHDLEEVVVIHDLVDDLVHIVRGVGVVRDDARERHLLPVARIGGEAPRRRVAVVQREVPEEAASGEERVHLVDCCQGRYPGDLRVDVRAAQLCRGHVLVRHRLHHLGAGDEELRRVFDHEDEVSERGRVDGPARARTHDHRDLGDDARRKDVALEDLRIPAQRVHALLDAGAARVVEADDRGAHEHSLVHDFLDLERLRLAERAAQDREVVREDEDEAPVDEALPGDDRVAGVLVLLHAELRAAVLQELVVLEEGTLIDEDGEALARAQLPFLVLRVDALLSAAKQCPFAQNLEVLAKLGNARLGLHGQRTEVVGTRTVRPTGCC